MLVRVSQPGNDWAALFCGGISCSSLLTPIYAVNNAGATPEEECFWPPGCEWSGLTADVSIPAGVSSWKLRHVLPLGEVGTRRCQVHFSVPGRLSSSAASHLHRFWNMMWFRAKLGGVLGHMSGKQYENSEQHPRGLLLSSPAALNTWLPKCIILPKMSFPSYPKCDGCSTSWAATACRGYPAGGLWQGIANPAYFSTPKHYLDKDKATVSSSR